MFVPNLFSPNGDNNNDLLHIYGWSVDEIDFRVYDRWGELIFQSTNPNISTPGSPTWGWDGTFKGVELNSAVFVYTLEVTYMDGREQVQHGNITLIR